MKVFTRRITALALICLLSGSILLAQPSEKKLSPTDYISLYKDDAIAEMLMHGIPASITLAQGMLESGNGNSALSVYANNHFGIKCHVGWTGESYYMDDDAKNECFRKYEKVLDSYTDHSLFLKNRPRYAFLFDLPLTDYKGWAKGLKQAGYATHPKYAEQLIELIEKYKLDQYDKQEGLPVKPIASSEPKTKMELRQVLRFNGTKFIIAKSGDSFYKLATEFNLELEDLLTYNDLTTKDKLQAGTKIYVERKRRRAKEPYHVVTKGETIKSISQLHGIRMYHLYKKNRMKPGQEPKVGDVLFLRHKKPLEIKED
ncbi:MAG TPA: glucosaminidase domain-containing protein [Bacteroidia bacterium]